LKLDKRLLMKQEKIPQVKVGYPSPKEGSEGDMQIRAVPNKGLFLFYKYGNNWYGSRMEKSSDIKNPRDDRRVVVQSGASKKTGEISRSGNTFKGRIADGTDKELYRAGGTDIPVADGGTGASTEDGALDNLGGTTVGKNVFKAASKSAARSAISVDEAGTDNSTPVTFAAGAKDYLSLSGQEITVGLVDLSDNVTGLLAKSSVNTASTWADSDIPNLSANKINADSFHLDRIPTIPNTKLQNDSISLGGVSVDLGSSNATPAFDLQNSTNTNLDSIKSGSQISAANISDVESFSQSGTYSGLTAGTVTTNANLTGDITSSGNATTYNNAVPEAKGGTGVTSTTAVGKALLGIADGSGERFIKINDDETITVRTDSQFRGDIGAGTSNFDGDYGSLSNIPSTFAPIIGAASNQALAGNTTVTNWDGGSTGLTAGTGRTSLGLGTAATKDTGTAAGNVILGNDSRLSDARQCNNTFVDTSTARSNLGVDPAGTDNSTPVTIASGKDYISLSGQELTLGNIDLTSDVTGTLPIGNTEAKVTEVDGNTGAVTAAEIRATALTDATAGQLSASKAIITDANSRIDEIKPELITVGTGSGQGVIKSNGNHNISISTGNTTTGAISIVNGANGAINLATNGTGVIRVGSGTNPGHITTKSGHDLKLSTNDDTNSGTITITDGTDGDITIAPQRNVVANKPIGFTHYALSDISGDAATLDFDFGTNGNKIRVAFTAASATISEARLVFPTNISGNYTVIVKNHTSAITKNEITLWTSSFGTAGTDKVNVKWPNNTIPSVTESDPSRIDIFSFYWDCNDKIAYGVSTLNFYSS